jgi:uncharacterized coiled-coil protein SlyX
MKCTIDQGQETIDLFSQKCEALIEVIKELEGEKDLQEDKIKALKTKVRDFNGNRLAQPGRVAETGPHFDEENRKLSGDDDGVRGSAADVCIRPQQAKEEQYQTDSPKTRSGAHTAQSKRRNSKHQEDRDTVAKSNAKQAKQMIRVLSETCVTLTQVIQALEGEKHQQEDKIETLETQLQEFNADRLGRSSRVSETGPYLDEDTRKLPGDDDGFRGSATAVCLWPQQAKEEKDQTDSPDKVANFFYVDARRIETLLDTQLQEFNADRLGRSSRVTEMGPCSDEENRKLSGDDDGFRCSAADVCLSPQQAKEEKDQADSPDKVADFFYEDTRKKIQGGDDGFRGNSAEFFLGQQQEAKEDEDQTSSLSITSFAEDLIL